MSQFRNILFDSSNLSPFGDLIANELTPVFQTDAIYGLLTQQVSNTISGTGALVDTNAGRYRIQSGTTATTGSAILTSAYPIRYRAGQGVIARFTTAFTTGLANSVQEIGVGNTVDKYAFGYNGTTFGILHRNNGSDTWIPQSTWNGDKVDGTAGTSFTLNPTFGNVCQIVYPFLGYGNITFFIENPNTGRLVLVHSIRYANTTATIQISNPALNFWARSANTGANTTNLTIYVGSVGIFVAGKKEYIAGQFAADNLKTAITTELNVLSIRNCTTFNGQPNKAIVRISKISIASDGGNGIARIRVRKGTTLGGTPAFTTISGTTGDNGVTITSGQSVCSQDTAGTTVTGGTVQFNTTCARNGNSVVDVSDDNLFIYPGETMTFSALAQVSSDVAVSASWDEDI
jgi:hypothetical protein